jgi:hypothetical protein
MIYAQYKKDMTWNNASLDEPPQEGQLVLMSVDGIYYVGKYDSKKNVYRLKEEPDNYFTPDEHLIYWTEFTNPDEII